MVGCESSSAKMKVVGEEVAWVIRSVAARGEVVVLDRAMNGWFC